MSSTPHFDLANPKDDAAGPLAIVVSQCVEGSSLVAPHSHARGQLLGVWRGLLTLGTEFGRWLVPNVHAVWVPPGQLHWASAHGQVDAWSVYVQPGACEGLPGQPATLRISGLLREAVRRLESLHGEPAAEAAEMQDLLERVVVSEVRSLPVEELSLPMPTSPSLVKIAQGLLAQPAEDRPLDAWASLANVSPRTLIRRFPIETGYSFGAWRQRARLLRGLELLAEGRSVTTVALDLGYCNISAFIALFKRTFGVTPTQYMRQAEGVA